MIQREDPVERQKAREQRPDPEDAGGDFRQNIAFRSDPEGDQHAEDQEEPQSQPEAAAGAGGKPQIAQKQRHHGRVSLTARLMRRPR